ncbi:SprB repeat-containing protein [Crocinitomix catalasitica]|uniref:SprB repeat-containing protein n=1 Tax=Crocinitomix catalasitica TaxID=184607 RepID=UPI0004884271|nr:SprB repeat-containing protein [Crocinitomix catalasitica]
MKKIVISILLVLTGFISFSQDELRFTDVSSEAAYCRLYSYQNGNGQVTATATGGTPNYSYLWVNLTSGELIDRATWGGLNPGDYLITITDNDGTSISQTVTVDSLNPIASFDVVSDDVEPIDWGYIGAAPAEVTFVNTSQYFANPLNPFSDTTFFFRPQGYEEWALYEDYYEFASYTYNYGGIFTPCLVSINKNGCRDTMCTTIGLFGPLSIEGSNSSNIISITSQSSTNQISIQQTEIKNGSLVKIYSLNGQLITQEEIYTNTSQIPFNETRGIYIFEFYEKNSMQLIGSGKFNY